MNADVDVVKDAMRFFYSRDPLPDDVAPRRSWFDWVGG